MYVSCLFAATLSTFSSGINSAAAVVWEDFVRVRRPIDRPLRSCDGRSLQPHIVWAGKEDDAHILLVNRVLVAALGLVATVIGAYARGEGVINSSYHQLGGMCGPEVGLFLVAVLVPAASSRAACI